MDEKDNGKIECSEQMKHIYTCSDCTCQIERWDDLFEIDDPECGNRLVCGKCAQKYGVNCQW